jgi:hypothetical protein
VKPKTNSKRDLAEHTAIISGDEIIIIYIQENIKNKDVFDWIKINNEIWLKEAKEAYDKKFFFHNGWKFDSYKKIVSSVKSLKYWGFVDSTIVANVTYNGKRLTVSIKAKKE